MLGNPYEARDAEYMDSARPGFHSTKGVGRVGPDPAGTVVLNNGVAIPLGRTVSTAIPAHAQFEWWTNNGWSSRNLDRALSAGLEEAVKRGVFPVTLEVKGESGSFSATLSSSDQGTLEPTTPIGSSMFSLFGSSNRAEPIIRKKTDPSNYFRLNYNEYIVYNESQV